MHLITRCILQRMQGAPRQPSDSSVIGSRASDRNHPWQSRFNVITSWYIVLIILVAILLERRLGLLSRCLSRSKCGSPMSWLWGFCWKRRRPAWSLVIVRVILPASASSSFTSNTLKIAHPTHLMFFVLKAYLGSGFRPQNMSPRLLITIIIIITGTDQEEGWSKVSKSWLSGSGCEEGTPPRLILGNCWGHTARPDHDYEEKTLQFNVTAWNLSVACLPGQMDHYRLPRDWGTDGNFSNTGLCSEGTWLLSRGAVFTSRCSCFSKSSYYQGGVAQILGLSGSRNMVAAFQILPRYSDSKHTHILYTPR